MIRPSRQCSNASPSTTPPPERHTVAQTPQRHGSSRRLNVTTHPAVSPPRRPPPPSPHSPTPTPAPPPAPPPPPPPPHSPSRPLTPPPQPAVAPPRLPPPSHPTVSATRSTPPLPRHSKGNTPWQSAPSPSPARPACTHVPLGSSPRPLSSSLRP